MKYFLVSKTMAYPIRSVYSMASAIGPIRERCGRWLKCDPAGGGGTAGGGDGWFNLKAWMNWLGFGWWLHHLGSFSPSF